MQQNGSNFRKYKKGVSRSILGRLCSIHLQWPSCGLVLEKAIQFQRPGGRLKSNVEYPNGTAKCDLCHTAVAWPPFPFLLDFHMNSMDEIRDKLPRFLRLRAPVRLPRTYAPLPARVSYVRPLCTRSNTSAGDRSGNSSVSRGTQKNGV